MNALDKLPSRIRYYLLEWKDKHMEDFLRKYGHVRLRDLNHDQLCALFGYATLKDLAILDDQRLTPPQLT